MFDYSKVPKLGPSAVGMLEVYLLLAQILVLRVAHVSHLLDVQTFSFVAALLHTGEPGWSAAHFARDWRHYYADSGAHSVGPRLVGL